MHKRRKSFLSCTVRHQRRIANELAESYQHDDDTLDGTEEIIENVEMEERESSTVAEATAFSVNCISDFDSEESDDNCGDSSESIEEPSNLMEDLREWASSGVTLTKVSQLLKLLRSHHCFSEWPADARTLLSTPRETPIKMIAGGSYHHIGLKFKINQHLDSYRQLQLVDNLKLQCCVDGLPLSRSTNSQLWPILVSFDEFNEIKPFAVGIYHGNCKPKSAEEYLGDFKAELLEVLNLGIQHNGKSYKVHISGFILDTPAYSFVTQTVSHTAYYSCRRCVCKGKYEDSNVAFNELHCELRTDESFRNQQQEEHHKGHSPFQELTNIDMVRSFPYDYMHLACLGVMRKMLFLFTIGPLLVRLPSSLLAGLSETLESIAEHIPMEFARKPRTVRDLKRWKATEFRQFLLYTGPFALRKIVSDDVYLHFLCFNFAMRCFVGSRYTNHQNIAGKLLLYFVENFKNIYGKKSVSHNVHALIHLHHDVSFHGCLERISAFKFEDELQRLKRLVRKKDKPLQQIIRRQREMGLKATGVTQCSDLVKKNIETLPMGLLEPEFSRVTVKNVKVSVMKPDNYVFLRDGTLCQVLHIATLNGECHIYGQPFKDITDFYAAPARSSKVGIYLASKLGDPRVWPINDIASKAVVIPLKRVHGIQEYYVTDLIHL
ncbi:hypothetical protein J437_LFUL010163 [Ladona fulva]|uniref:Transposase domain-containing protein n=1 Tax=Ladona fulva TaxID=123851 RepID=A0A8K0KA42_LADFU|nr:hypothetical protein J437_LFUL010163 [Ladona fulva]